MLFVYEMLPMNELVGAVPETRMRRHIIFVTWICCMTDILTVDFLGVDPAPFHSLRTYFYLTLTILHSEMLWNSIVNFISAIEKAMDVISFFVVAVLVGTSLSLSLLKGEYETGDFSPLLLY